MQLANQSPKRVLSYAQVPCLPVPVASGEIAQKTFHLKSYFVLVRHHLEPICEQRTFDCSE